jgi:aminoglycoside phosphotransferase (APT) family kinase protein
VTIPSSPDELTAKWLGEALETDVSSVEVIDAHSGTTGRAKIRVKGADLPETLFVKLQPFTEDQRALQEMIRLGTAEAKLYAAVGDELPVRVPKVWHSSFDDADGSFIMVLEDLEASGCHFSSAEDDDVLSVAESMVDELATLHATYWGQELPWLGEHALSAHPSPDAEERAKMGAAFVQMAIDQFADDLPPEFRQLGELYVAQPLEIRRLFNEGEPTLIHGDNHIGNLFVDAGRTGFYDWAVASRFPAMRDITYFLCNSMPTEVRRSEEDRLIARYRAGLAAAGVTLDAALAQEQHRLASIVSWISATTTAAMGSTWQPADVGWRATVRTTDAIVDLDVLGLLAERGIAAT